MLVGGVLAAAGISRLLKRDEFKSVAAVQISTPPTNTFSHPYFLLTEFEVFRSHAVLTNVIASLHLNEIWGKRYNHGRVLSDSEAEERIKSHLELQNVRNTRIVEIITYDEDPEEAAKLANALAWRYGQLRTEEFERRAAEPGNVGIIADPMVTLMDSAVPEYRPVRPNRYLAGVMLGCGMFLMIVGIVCLSDRGAALAG